MQEIWEIWVKYKKVIETHKCTQAAWPPIVLPIFDLPCQLWGIITFEQVISLCWNFQEDLISHILFIWKSFIKIWDGSCLNLWNFGLSDIEWPYSGSLGERKKGNKWHKMTKTFFCLTPYLRNHTSYDCNFWCTCVKWYLQQLFSFFKVLIFGVFKGIKGKKWPKIRNWKIIRISGTVDHIIKILIMISRDVFHYLFLKNATLYGNINFFFFLIMTCFFKFINKCQKEILRCAAWSSHVFDFYE